MLWYWKWLNICKYYKYVLYCIITVLWICKYTHSHFLYTYSQCFSFLLINYILYYYVLQTKVTNVLSAIEAAEYLISNNASQVVRQVVYISFHCPSKYIISLLIDKYHLRHGVLTCLICTVGNMFFHQLQETDKFIKNLMGYFTQYTDWIRHSVSMMYLSEFGNILR